MEKTSLEKVIFALLKGTVSTKNIKESILYVKMFYLMHSGETINTMPLITPYIDLKDGLTQKQIKHAIKKYLPNHAICHFIEFLEKYGIKEKYLKNADLTEDNLILMLLKKPAIRYLDSVFYWKHTKEGYAYWEMIRTWWLEYIDKQEQRHSTY